ncbi:hypothetical protein A6A08_19365 [Nocardiopsis sp. TSRI0078]|uniref:DUF6243 family protein n=1 Tax=unclassified Nocardiopsis TaxID=2649073 RepID=UPI00093D0365|nr:DUF6243 family protein [Nocardiopsis sp. TSRI0078]OKI22427.1 hypothetical protein A6A08_19365 [Nocardiopsis sp. TSRI0078]
MARNSDNLLGMGGQRTTVSRSALRGDKGGSKGGPSTDAVERRQELLRRLQEKNASRGSEGSEKAGDAEGTA